MNRQYVNEFIHAILEAVNKLPSDSEVYFLVTGNTVFNITAYQALKKRLKRPFMMLVYMVQTSSYEAFSSEALSGWSS
jgi:hypothetical protein